jgi:hypothetical protein
MRRILYLAPIALALGFSAVAFSQGGGGGGMGGGGGGAGGGSGFGGGGTGAGGGGSGFGGGGTGAGGGGSGFTGGGGSTFSGSGGGTSFTGGAQGMSGNTSTGTGRTGAGGRAIGGSGGVSISPTNFLASTYGNPLYPGRPGSTNIALVAGGFGQPSFGVTTTTVTTRAGGVQPGTQRGGTATVGGFTGTQTAPISPITYAVEVKFPAPPIVAPKLQAELQGLISRTAALRQPGNVSVEVVGTTVILRGRVADDDERRLVEGMMRLEPGVHEVRNELVVP